MSSTPSGKKIAPDLRPKEYDRLSYRKRVVRAIGEGLDDLREGRATSDADLTKELDRLHLRGLLLEGAASVGAEPAGAGYFKRIRRRVSDARKNRDRN
jgi:hypothetical protein